MIIRALHLLISRDRLFLCFEHQASLKSTRRIDNVVRVINHNLLFLCDILLLFMRVKGLDNRCHKWKAEEPLRICDRLVCLSSPLVAPFLCERVMHPMS